MMKSSIQRTEIILPQVKGYNIYKGDFHIHTNYSDGTVNPAGRVTEAWLDGLDIIAITDHYENHAGVKKFLKITAAYNEDGVATPYQNPSKVGSVKVDFNAIHDEAANKGEKQGYPMLLIKGCEMARNNQTHGHFNCLFLKNINGLYDKDLMVAFKRVKDQGGIVVHNHPGWRRKNTDKTEFHEAAYSAGLIDGVEVVNGHTFYPHIVKRCIDEKLTMFANTDMHGVSTYNRMSPKVFRTMTLVLAKELTEEAVKEAILKRRTIAYTAGNLIGEEKWLVELLNESVDCRMVLENKEKGTRKYQLTNHSSIPYTLRKGKKTYVLEPFKSIFIVFGKDEEGKRYLEPTFRIENMWHVDYQHPTIEIELDK
jgi:predicted metal-dependent phosphoesterase TrpH